jgi:capsular polysaccharide biosynthesis protein
MIYLVKAFLALWAKRWHFLMPLIFVPAAVMAFFYSYQPLYTATTVVSVDADQASTSVLRHIERQESIDILNRRLMDDRLIEDTIKQSGLSLSLATKTKPQRDAFLQDFKKRINLAVLNAEMVRITYKAETKEEATHTLERLAINFIDEVLAPERFKAEETLMNLGEQVQHYARQEKTAFAELDQLNQTSNKDAATLKQLVRLEFEAQKAASQRALAQESYDSMLAQSRKIIGDRGDDRRNGLLKIEDAPVVMASTLNNATQKQILITALFLGFMLGLILVTLSYLMDDTLRDSDDIYHELGLRILGRIPNLGIVQNDGGALSIDLTTHNKDA